MSESIKMTSQPKTNPTTQNTKKTIIEEISDDTVELLGEDYAMKLVLINGLRRKADLCCGDKLKELFIKRNFIYKNSDSKRSLLRKLKQNIKHFTVDDLYGILKIPQSESNPPPPAPVPSTVPSTNPPLSVTSRPMSGVLDPFLVDNAFIEENVMSTSTCSARLQEILGDAAAGGTLDIRRDNVLVGGGERRQRAVTVDEIDQLIQQLDGIQYNLKALVGQEQNGQPPSSMTTSFNPQMLPSHINGNEQLKLPNNSDSLSRTQSDS